MLADPTMVRRPLLEPNATKGCLVFLGCSLFVFLMANVITSDPSPDDIKAAEGGVSLLNGTDNGRQQHKPEEYGRYGPGYYLLNALPSIPTHPFIRGDHAERRAVMSSWRKRWPFRRIWPSLCRLIVIGYWHFENTKWDSAQRCCI